MTNKGLITVSFVGILLLVSGCKQQTEVPKGSMQAFPVQTQTIALAPVQQSSDYVATIKSRRSVSIMPQVSGNLTQLLVRSGDRVKTGQLMFVVNPLQQQSLVDAQQSTENQKKALYDYNTIQIERQRKLFDAGVVSRDTLDQAEQSYANTKADWQAAIATRKSLQEQLNYYNIKAPFEGYVGDVPAHLGDYVTPQTMVTTVDENRDLEAYIYVPTERGSEVRLGIPVQILDSTSNVVETSTVDFLSPQIDSQTQGILIKAPVHSTTQMLRTSQLVKTRIIWKTAPQPVVPVLAVSRQGGSSFVFVASKQPDGHYIARQTAVVLGDTVGNNYAVNSGLKPGDKVIVSGTQFLVDNMPVQPLR